MLSAESCKTLLLGGRVDIGTNHKSNDVEEGDPGLLREELLSKCKRNWRGDPADLHDWHEASLPSCVDLVESTCTGNDGHRDQVHGVLDWCNLIGLVYCVRACIRQAYQQVADKNLKDLGLQACSTGEDLLENADENMPKWSGDKCTIYCHLRYSGCEIMSVLVSILCDPRSEQLLEGSKTSRCEHLRPQWIGSEVFEVYLIRLYQKLCAVLCRLKTYSQVPRLSDSTLPSSESCSNIRGNCSHRLLNCVLLEFDRHRDGCGCERILESRK
jgi:hypothetical protein